MGAVIFISLGIIFLLSIPIITSRFAKRLGRDPKAWFFIGLFLPIIATFILFFLQDLSDVEEENENK
jgi:Na+/melibiose symporter-like transporter